MTSISEFIKELPNFTGIFILMLSTFLIGYFAASWFQKNKYKKIIARLKKEVNRLKIPLRKSEPTDIDSIFSEIKPRIIEVVKQAQEEIVEEEEEMFQEEVVPEEKEIPEPQEEESEEIEEVSRPEAIAQRARSTFVNYSIDKPELDFDSFGYADHDQKDDLTKIMGIGPYIEQKLNEIGICNYSQISKLNDSDIRVITELIDFFPGRIERDNWVGQAKALSKVY
jgi:predicted flap endonuclease-1-like 5' DNA nuclease